MEYRDTKSHIMTMLCDDAYTMAPHNTAARRSARIWSNFIMVLASNIHTYIYIYIYIYCIYILYTYMYARRWTRYISKLFLAAPSRHSTEPRIRCAAQVTYVCGNFALLYTFLIFLPLISPTLTSPSSISDCRRTTCAKNVHLR